MNDLAKIKEIAEQLKKSIYDRYGVTEQQMINIQKDKLNEIISLINLLIENVETMQNTLDMHFVYNPETESLELVNVTIKEGES